mmetsp:Transcript_30362/g.90124  ORF Transcript_30362/g.90124 Transcript_30362/m.90124 type:complete len:328 (+) Transcript_30362:542-1525(+)
MPACSFSSSCPTCWRKVPSSDRADLMASVRTSASAWETRLCSSSSPSTRPSACARSAPLRCSSSSSARHSARRAAPHWSTMDFASCGSFCRPSTRLCSASQREPTRPSTASRRAMRCSSLASRLMRWHSMEAASTWPDGASTEPPGRAPPTCHAARLTAQRAAVSDTSLAVAESCRWVLSTGSSASSGGSSGSSASVSSRMSASNEEVARWLNTPALSRSWALSARRRIRSSAASTCRSLLSSASSSHSLSICSASLLDRCSASLRSMWAMRRPSSSHEMRSRIQRSCVSLAPPEPPVQASPCGVCTFDDWRGAGGQVRAPASSAAR